MAGRIGPFSENEKRRVVLLARQGCHLSEIAQALERDIRSVDHYVRENNIRVRLKILRIQPGSARASDDLIRQRDERIAADNRTAAQRWLGDPPSFRSALSRRRDGSDAEGMK